MLSKADILCRLDSATDESPLHLWLDTSAVHGSRTLVLGDEVSHWRERRGAAGAVELHISPFVFVERNAQERRRQGQRFDPKKVWTTLASKGIHVDVFDGEAADLASSRLAKWFPSDEDWDQEKWVRICEIYGVAKAAPSRHVSATVDWFISATVPQAWVVVTDDRGGEFQRVDAAVEFATLVEAVRLSR